MKTKKLFKVMSVLSSTMMISLFSLGAIAQDRAPGDNKIEVVKAYTAGDFNKMRSEYLQEQMTVKIDNTYVYNPYKYIKHDFIIDKDKVNRKIANEDKDLVLVLDKGQEVTKKDISKLTEDEKKDLNLSQADIDKHIAEMAKTANIEDKTKEKIKEEVTDKTEVKVEEKTKELDVENTYTEAELQADINQKEKQKKEEAELKLAESEVKTADKIEVKVEAKAEELVVENVYSEAELQYDIDQKAKQIKEDAEQLLVQAEQELAEDQVIEDAIEVVEDEVAVLEEAVDTEEDTEEIKKIKAELEEAKKILAETKDALKESKESNKIVRSKSLNIEKAYCSQQDQISTLTAQMNDFQSNIYAPIQTQMDAMMQMMMMNQFANRGFNLDRGYSSLNGQNNFGMDYGMKMFGLSELFKTGSMGGMTNNYYNVGGNYYGGAYSNTNSTSNPMVDMFGNRMGQQDPRMQFGNPNNAAYSYDFGGVSDTTNRSSYNQMDYQNVNRGPSQYYQGGPYMNPNMNGVQQNNGYNFM